MKGYIRFFVSIAIACCMVLFVACGGGSGTTRCDCGMNMDFCLVGQWRSFFVDAQSPERDIVFDLDIRSDGTVTLTRSSEGSLSWANFEIDGNWDRTMVDGEVLLIFDIMRAGATSVRDMNSYAFLMMLPVGQIVVSSPAFPSSFGPGWSPLGSNPIEISFVSFSRV